jgi:RNA polymerase sigma-70 factor (ECF subfamily)
MPPTVDLFEKMLLPHLGAAYNLARWLTHNAHDAEDVVQESYLKALRSFHTFRVEADGRAWLLKVVRNTFYTWLQRNRDHRLSTNLADEPQYADGASLDPEAVLIKAASLESVHKALKDLPLEYREVLVLREFEGFSYKQIAEISDLPIGTVMSRISRARRDLRARLSDAAQKVGQ